MQDTFPDGPKINLGSLAKTAGLRLIVSLFGLPRAKAAAASPRVPHDGRRSSNQ